LVLYINSRKRRKGRNRLQRKESATSKRASLAQVEGLRLAHPELLLMRRAALRKDAVTLLLLPLDSKKM
jgi:hypothetical protein